MMKMQRANEAVDDIDSIAASEGLMPFIEGFEAIEFDEKTSSDHSGHVVKLNLENFYNENLNEINQSNRSKLYSSRRSNKEIFILKIEEELNCVIL